MVSKFSLGNFFSRRANQVWIMFPEFFFHTGRGGQAPKNTRTPRSFWTWVGWWGTGGPPFKGFDTPSNQASQQKKKGLGFYACPFLCLTWLGSAIVRVKPAISPGVFIPVTISPSDCDILDCGFTLPEIFPRDLPVRLDSRENRSLARRTCLLHETCRFRSCVLVQVCERGASHLVGWHRVCHWA